MLLSIKLPLHQFECMTDSFKRLTSIHKICNFQRYLLHIKQPGSKCLHCELFVIYAGNYIPGGYFTSDDTIPCKKSANVLML